MSSFLSSFIHIRRQERTFSFLMFSYFFSFILVFWIFKPLKKTMFIRYYDQTGFDLLQFHFTAAQAELLAKILNLVIAFSAMLLFSFMSRHLKKAKLTAFFAGLFALLSVICAVMLKNPGAATVWGFYFLGDVFVSVMLACFFSFAADSLKPEMATRLYGFIVLGGVTGGVVGTTFVRATIKSMPIETSVFICAGLCALIVLMASLAEKHAPVADIEAKSPVEKPEHGLFRGAKLVFDSKYLLALFAVIGIYEILSQTIDFQFTQSVEHFLDGKAIGHHFATVYAMVNWMSLFVQVFLTTFFLRKLGVGKTLSVLPSVILVLSLGFLILPILWIASILMISDNSLNYSINQSARETLYVVCNREEKYLAKGFIDVFGVRFGKVVAILAILLISSYFSAFESLRWLSLFTIPLAAIWLMLVWFLGRKYLEQSQAGASE